jgi:hypothetical protein
MVQDMNDQTEVAVIYLANILFLIQSTYTKGHNMGKREGFG